MFSSKNNFGGLQLLLVVCVASLALGLLQAVMGQPSSRAPLANEIDDGKSTTLQMKDVDEAEQSFRKFIDSDPKGSTVIGEIKSNASALEMMLLRNKIADTILSMQEQEKKRLASKHAEAAAAHAEGQSESPECYIEVTRVEKIPGKCQRVNGGQPVCQSAALMSLSSECN